MGYVNVYITYIYACNHLCDVYIYNNVYIYIYMYIYIIIIKIIIIMIIIII